MKRFSKFFDPSMRSVILAVLWAWIGLMGRPDVHGREDGAGARLTVLVVVGAEGAEEYGEKFREAVDTWREAAAMGGAEFEVIGLEEDSEKGREDRARLEARLGELSARTESGPLWVVLVGHGTFDGRVAKFNVRGPDFTDADLAGWLKGSSRPLAVINTASASGPFIKSLAGENRVVITATKSAFEVFYARFGEHFARAIAGEAGADLDNDDQVSLLEAFLFSADQVGQFFEMEGRLATEHALIDDTGDGLGTPPDWFEGVRATKVAKDGARPDGELAHQWMLVPNAFERRLTVEQRERRDTLEREVRELSRQREALGDEGYYAKLEPVLLEIARIYESVRDEDEAAADESGEAAKPEKPEAGEAGRSVN